MPASLGNSACPVEPDGLSIEKPDYPRLNTEARAIVPRFNLDETPH